MQALTPVGRFPVRLTGAHLGANGPVLDGSLGAWRTEVELERSDLAVMVAALLALLVVLGVARRGKRTR